MWSVRFQVPSCITEIGTSIGLSEMQISLQFDKFVKVVFDIFSNTVRGFLP